MLSPHAATVRRMFGELRHLSYGAAGLGASAGRELTMGAVVSFGNRIEAEWFGREIRKRLVDGIPEPAPEPDFGWDRRPRRPPHLHLAAKRLVDPLARSVVIRHNGPFTTFSVRVSAAKTRELVALLELATGEAWPEAARWLAMF